jgi:hypothetical protein
VQSQPNARRTWNSKACRRASFRFNPLGTEGRVRNNQAHELVHVLLDHKVRTIERVGDLKFLTCDVEQEEEADWLGGCLLLPRELLLKAAFKGMRAQAISDKYKTSEPMARFRLTASGVPVQVGRAKANHRRDDRLALAISSALWPSLSARSFNAHTGRTGFRTSPRT